jgi:hypothetical protein
MNLRISSIGVLLPPIRVPIRVVEKREIWPKSSIRVVFLKKVGFLCHSTPRAHGFSLLRNVPSSSPPCSRARADELFTELPKTTVRDPALSIFPVFLQ